MRYVISYDLVAPGQNYDQLIEKLREFGASRLLQSQWIVRWNDTNAATVRDIIRAYIDENDRLLVTCLDSNDWASRNTMVKPSTV